MAAPRASSAGGGGVGKLLAMFEDKKKSDAGSSSPPEPRGRSPAPSVTSNTTEGGGTGKVRASFVSVERPSLLSAGSGGSGAGGSPAVGERGVGAASASASASAARNASASATSARNVSGGSAEGTSVGAEESRARNNQGLVDELKKTVVSKDKGVEKAQAATPGKTGTQTAAGASEKNEQEAATEEGEGKGKGKGKTAKVSATVRAATSRVAEKASETKRLATQGRSATKPAASARTGTTESTSNGASKAARSTAGRPSAISTSRDSPASKAGSAAAAPKARSPTKPTPQTQPQRSTATKMSSARTTASSTAARTSPTKTTSVRTSRPAAASSSTATSTSTRAPATSSSTTAPKATKKGVVTTGGFVKPPPRSPTKPVKLPSHLTAHTASSSAKHDPSSASAPPQTSVRKTSGGSRASTVTPRTSSIGVASGAASRRQSARPSVSASAAASGKPGTNRPSSRASQGSASRHSVGGAGQDSGFLARMMRPTASSASKTLDKPVEPARVSPKQQQKSGAPVAKQMISGARDAGPAVNQSEATKAVALGNGKAGGPSQPRLLSDEAPETVQKKEKEVMADEGGIDALDEAATGIGKEPLAEARSRQSEEDAPISGDVGVDVPADDHTTKASSEEKALAEEPPVAESVDAHPTTSGQEAVEKTEHVPSKATEPAEVTDGTAENKPSHEAQGPKPEAAGTRPLEEEKAPEAEPHHEPAPQTATEPDTVTGADSLSAGKTSEDVHEAQPLSTSEKSPEDIDSQPEPQMPASADADLVDVTATKAQSEDALAEPAEKGTSTPLGSAAAARVSDAEALTQTPDFEPTVIR